MVYQWQIWGPNWWSDPLVYQKFAIIVCHSYTYHHLPVDFCLFKIVVPLYINVPISGKRNSMNLWSQGINSKWSDDQLGIIPPISGLEHRIIYGYMVETTNQIMIGFIMLYIHLITMLAVKSLTTSTGGGIHRHMHTYTYTNTYTYCIHLHIHILLVHTYTHTCMYVCMYVCMYLCVSMCIYVYLCVSMYLCIYYVSIMYLLCIYYVSMYLLCIYYVSIMYLCIYYVSMYLCIFVSMYLCIYVSI